MGNLRLRSWKTKKPRCLRTYEHVAQRTHRCDHCAADIRSGDIYSGEVWVTVYGRLHVDKEHKDPPCEHPYDEDWQEFGDEMERQEERESELETSVSEAA